MATEQNKEDSPVSFALLGHPANYGHLRECVLQLFPGQYDVHKESLLQAFEQTHSYALDLPIYARSANGQQASGKLVICTFLPERLDNARQLAMAHKKIIDGCRVAHGLGAKVIGLGGFTSIIGGTQGEWMATEINAALTSGNSLTAALALAQLDQLFGRLNWSLQGRSAAILGATGDIGRACALSLAARGVQLTLLARNKAKLAALHDELLLETQITTDVKAALQADIIIAATSTVEPILAEADLHPGTVVCDIGYPKNLSYVPDPRSDVLVMSAGMAIMPFALNLTEYTRLPAANLMYGCFAEAMVLALARRYESYSIGQGRITLEKMATILSLSQQHGFHPAPLYRGDRLIDDTVLETFLHQYDAAKA